MSTIVTDERRCDGPKAARPCGVARSGFVDGVASLDRVPDPLVAPLLATKPLRAIATYQVRQDRL